ERFAKEKTTQLLADKKVAAQFGIHAVSEAINAGLFNESVIGPLSATLFSDRLNRLSYSPFNQYFIIQAMALAGKNAVALATIKDCWGGQIAYGGTSFFEVFRPSWNTILNTNDAPPNNQCGYTSLAHPWGAGVTKWLSENVLGIKPVSPGFKTFTIIPFLKDSLTQVKGTMPTPFGMIAASFNIQSGDCEITVPPGTMAEQIGLPKGGRQIDKITLSKKMSGKPRSYQPAIISKAGEDSNFMYLKNLQAGRYKIKISYKGVTTTPFQTVEPFNYLIQSFVQDSITTGNWATKFGKEGYVLFGYPDTAGSKKIPSYIDSVTLKKNGIIIWDSVSADNRVLKNPAGKNELAAAIITRDPEATNQTMTIDIAVKGNHACRLSMYFLDWDKKDRRTAIEIFDANTLNIIAPVQLISHYENGKYLTFTFDRSVRIRVNHVRGKNAAVSGLFFDSAE
ncbi:MAG: alpha-L-rhamnosidase C-terminal domain-containing protein, partial [Ferruginibacter sp.]